jgi:hypothetical protein
VASIEITFATQKSRARFAFLPYIRLLYAESEQLSDGDGEGHSCIFATNIASNSIPTTFSA